MCVCPTKSVPWGVNAMGEEHLQKWHVLNVHKWALLGKERVKLIGVSCQLYKSTSLPVNWCNPVLFFSLGEPELIFLVEFKELITTSRTAFTDFSVFDPPLAFLAGGKVGVLDQDDLGVASEALSWFSVSLVLSDWITASILECHLPMPHLHSNSTSCVHHNRWPG